MPEGNQRVGVDEIDWAGVLPVGRLFESCRMALQPSKLLLALLLVGLLWVGGGILSYVGAVRVYPGEFDHYVSATPGAFTQWRRDRPKWTQDQLRAQLIGLVTPGDDVEMLVGAADPFSAVVKTIDEVYSQRRKDLLAIAINQSDLTETQSIGLRVQELEDHRVERIKAVYQLRPGGVFGTAVKIKLGAFERLIRASTRLDFGLGQLLGQVDEDRESVVGAMYEALVLLPGWLYRAHPWFGMFYGAWALVVWAFLGGMLARLAAMHATRDEHISVGSAFQFTMTRWVWFLVTPVMPLVLALALCLVLVLGGMAFFNVPVLDLVGGLLFIVALVCGVMVAGIVILEVASASLFYPAIAVEGTDGFDAISRAFGYVIGRPWRWLFYSLLALVYGALTYVLLGMVLYLAIGVTQRCVGLWVFNEVAPGLSRFDAMLPPPRMGHLAYEVQDWQLGGWGTMVARLVSIWVYAVIGLLAAYAVSYYFCASTWIYLLLRRSADGVEFDDVYIEPPQEEEPQQPELDVLVDELNTAAPNPSDQVSASDDANGPETGDETQDKAETGSSPPTDDESPDSSKPTDPGAPQAPDEHPDDEQEQSDE